MSEGIKGLKNTPLTQKKLLGGGYLSLQLSTDRRADSMHEVPKGRWCDFPWTGEQSLWGPRTYITKHQFHPRTSWKFCHYLVRWQSSCVSALANHISDITPGDYHEEIRQESMCVCLPTHAHLCVQLAGNVWPAELGPQRKILCNAEGLMRIPQNLLCQGEQQAG